MRDGPSLKQLRYLVALSEYRHFRKAAAAVGISQPSLSLQIGNLETCLDVTLVERGRGPVTLTPEGRAVVQHATRALAEVQGITDLAKAMQSGLTGTIRLGTTPTIGPYLMPLVVERLHAQYPDLRLYIREVAPQELRGELSAGGLDVILTQLPERGDDVVEHRLFDEPLLLAMAQEHPLAGRQAVTEADLQQLTVLSLGSKYAMQAQIAAICHQHGAVIARDYEGTSLDAIRQMVGMGMGVAFLPRLYAKSEIDGRQSNVVVRPFASNAIERRVGLVWRTGAGAAIYQRLSKVIIGAAKDHMQHDHVPLRF